MVLVWCHLDLPSPPHTENHEVKSVSGEGLGKGGGGEIIHLARFRGLFWAWYDLELRTPFRS